MIPRTFSIQPRGPFSLEELANFGFGQRLGARFDGAMRLAFCVDGGYTHQVGVTVRQDDDGVHCEVLGDADLMAVQRQVERVLSLDHDGEAFLEVGRRDPVIGRLQAAAPGLRPPLFYSPYEAAAWAVLSARRPARQMGELRRRLSEAHGESFDLAGERVAALPTPARMLEVRSLDGLPDEKLQRLHGVARAALEGRLDVERLTAIDPEAAMAELQAIRGIGPFYSSLVVIRACGLADVLPVNEPIALGLTGRLYGLGGPPGEPRFRALAEQWRPFRTWAVVLIRAVAGRLPAIDRDDRDGDGVSPPAP